MTDESLGARRKRELEKAQSAFPVIVQGLRADQEPVSLSAEIAQRFHVDEVLAYRWVDIIGSRFRHAVRRTAILGLGFLWAALMLIVAAIVPVVVGNPGTAGLFGIPLWLELAVCGVVSGAVGLFVALRARYLVLRGPETSKGSAE
jgi:uncharacterized membrane protein YhdT